MNKKLLSVSLLLVGLQSYSQVGIGTLTPNQSAQLDVVSNNKGILIPRVGLTNSVDASTIQNGNVNSLLVFNTNTQNDVTPGYYYWYNDRWMRIVNDADVVALDKNTTNQSLTVVGTDLVLTDSDGNTVSIALSAINIPTSLVKNPDGTYTFTNEAGDTIIIDATDNVINNIETILGDTNVLNELIEVLGDTYVGGNVYYDGTQFTYVDQSGATHVINMQDIVQANETVTTLTEANGIYTYTSEDGTVTVIDIPASVVENFEKIVNSGPVTVNGDTFTTIEEYIEYIANSSVTIGGSDFITVTGTGTAADPYVVAIEEGAANSMLITNAAGELEWATIETIVKANETVTTLTEANGIYTYTSEDGTVTVIDIPASVVENFETIVNSGPVTVNGDTFTTIEEYIEHIANSSVTIGGSDFITVTGTGTAADPYVVAIEEGAANSMLITNAAGELEWATIETIVKANETVTTLVDNNDGTYTYTSEDGTITNIDVPAAVVNQFESIYNDIVNEAITINGDTYTSFEEYLTNVANEAVTIGGSEFITVTGAGTAASPYVVSIAEGAANSMLITNAAGDVEWASLSTIVKANETITTLVDNNDGTYTYTSEDGTITNIDVPAAVVNQFESIYNDIVNEAITINGDTYTSFEEYLTNVANEAVTIGGSEFITVTGAGTAASPYVVSIAEGAANSMLITNAAGDVEWASLSTIVKANETVTTLVNNNDGTYTYTNEAGVPTIIDVPAAVVNQFNDIVNSGPVTVNGTTYTTIEEYLEDVVATNETVTNLTYDAATGIATYTNEAGTAQTIDLSDVVPNFETLTSIAFDSTTGILTYNDEEGVANTFNIKSLVTAKNGTNIDVTTKDVKLGGALTEATLISTDSINTLAVSGLTTGSDSDKIMVVQADGVLRTREVNTSRIVETAANYVTLDADAAILADAETADLTITLPTATPANKGRVITIRKVDESDNEVNFSETIKINKTQSFTSLNYAATIRIQSTGADWYMMD